MRSALSSALLAVFLCGACAFGDRHIKLTYPPEDSAAVAVPASAPLGAPAVHLGVFVDRRPIRNRVGEVRNGWGAHTADVLTESDVVEWVRGALRQELEQAGFRVLDAPATADALELRGEVLEIDCTASFSYEGYVTLQVEQLRDGQTLSRDIHRGTGGAGTNWGATSEAFAQTLALSLQQAARQVIGGLRNAPKP